MAYNGFPATYQPMYYPQYQTPQYTQQQPTQNTSIIWVSGEAGAKAYLTAPNTTVQLWDSESQTIYLKSADASGMPSIKILDYTIRGQTPTSAPVTPTDTTSQTYATKAEVDVLVGQINALKAEIDSLTAKRPGKKEAVSNE